MLQSTEPYNIESVIRKAIRNMLMGLHTVHPCKIRQVRDNGTVDVDLMVHSVFVNGEDKALPSITQLPILFQGNDNYTISFPVSVGDEGLAIFAERDISKFLENGKSEKPNALRFHNLSDGLFLPTPISSQKRLQVQNGTLLLSNKGTEIAIMDGLIRLNGNVEINGDTTTTGDINSDGEITADTGGQAVELSTHPHPFINADGIRTITEPPGEL